MVRFDLQLRHLNKGKKRVNSFRTMVLCALIAFYMPAGMAVAAEPAIIPGTPGFMGPVQPKPNGQKTVIENKTGLDEMRAWLNQRNMARQQQGNDQDESFNRSKPYSAVAKPQTTFRLKLPAERVPVSDLPPRPSLALPAPPTGRGPDGRIHHRVIINEEGPDQFQVYTGSGYATPNSGYALKPKGWNHPKYSKR